MVQAIVAHFLKDAGPAELRKRMEKAMLKIAAGMEAKDITPQDASGRVVVRDALFRLWRSVIPSGDISDLIRDVQDDKVLAVVGPITQTMTTEAVVQKTLDALIAVTF